MGFAELSPEQYPKYIVTWQATEDVPRQFTTWLTKREAEDRKQKVLDAAKAIRLAGFTEAPRILVINDDD